MMPHERELSQFLVPMGKILFTASLGIAFVQTMRGVLLPVQVVERALLGFLGLTFFSDLLSGLQNLSILLTARMTEFGQDQDVRTVVLGALGKTANGFDVDTAIGQVWRLGVWGAMQAFIEGLFLLVGFVVEKAQEVLWSLLLFLFPMALGFFPVLPKLLFGFLVYAVELSLWLPLMVVVERVTGRVAAEYLLRNSSFGLSIVAVELVASVLILAVPAATHRFVSGALSGDFDSQARIFVWSQRLAGSVSGRGFKKGGV